MRFKVEKLSMLRFTYTAILIAISSALFVYVIGALTVFVKVREGMASWVATMSMLVAGIGELGFIVYSGDTFRRIREGRAISNRFLTLLMVLGWLFFLLEIFKLWTFIPNPRGWITYAPALLTNFDYALGLCGLAVGVGSVVVLKLRNKNRRR